MATKSYQPIGQVCKNTGLDRSTIYVWEKEIPFLKPSRSSGKHRYYNNEQVEMLLYIKQLRYEEGYTLEGVKKRLTFEKQQIKSIGQCVITPIDTTAQPPKNTSAEQHTAFADFEKLKLYLMKELKEILLIPRKDKN